MKSGPKLVLKREALSTLASDELVVVVGASLVLGCTNTCGCSGVCPTYTATSGATNRCTEFCDIPQLTHVEGRCHA